MKISANTIMLIVWVLSPFVIPFIVGCEAKAIKTVDTGNKEVTAFLIANINGADIYRVRDGDQNNFYVIINQNPDTTASQSMKEGKSLYIVQKTLEKEEVVPDTPKITKETITDADEIIILYNNKIKRIEKPQQVIISNE